jgi:hypothetical protein
MHCGKQHPSLNLQCCDSPSLSPPQAPSAGHAALKRPLQNQASFSFHAPARPTAAAHDATLKRRRVQYDRMRELETQVQRVRHLGDALSQSLRQAEAQVGISTLAALPLTRNLVPTAWCPLRSCQAHPPVLLQISLKQSLVGVLCPAACRGHNRE